MTQNPLSTHICIYLLTLTQTILQQTYIFLHRTVVSNKEHQPEISSPGQHL